MQKLRRLVLITGIQRSYGAMYIMGLSDRLESGKYGTFLTINGKDQT